MHDIFCEVEDLTKTDHCVLTEEFLKEIKYLRSLLLGNLTKDSLNRYPNGEVLVQQILLIYQSITSFVTCLMKF